MRRQRGKLIMLCGVLFVTTWPSWPAKLVITIAIPGYWPLACLLGGIVGLYLLAEQYQHEVKAWIEAIVYWLHGD